MFNVNWWFVEDTLEYISNFFMVDGFVANWHLSQILYFGLHFRSNLKGLLMGWEVKNLLSCQSKHGLVGSSAKTRNYLSRESQEWKTCTFLGPKHKSAIWDGTLPHLHIKFSLYVWRRTHGSQIFNRNSINSIRLRFIAILRFQLLWLQEGRGRWMGGI